MKTLYYVLVLSIIFTGYLFSQSEENEIIEMYTLTKANTIVATETDTTIFSEHVNEQEGKEDFIKYNFYNDYLADLKKTSFINTNIADTLAVNDCKKTGIISAKAECTLFFLGGSVTWNMPLRYYSNITFASKCLLVVEGGSGGGISTGFGLGLGYIAKRSDDVILRFNIYPSFMFTHNEKFIFGIIAGTDVIIWNVFSVGIDAFVFSGHFYPFPTVGLNIVY